MVKDLAMTVGVSENIMKILYLRYNYYKPNDDQYMDLYFNWLMKRIERDENDKVVKKAL